MKAVSHCVKRGRRRTLMALGSLLGVGVLPGPIRSALAQDSKNLANILKSLKPVPVRRPIALYQTSAQGTIGPWGEVRVMRADNLLLPALLRSANTLGMINFTVRRPFVQIGVGRPDVITWTSSGVAFGQRAPTESWSAALVSKLARRIATDVDKARALMQLRASLASAFPVHLKSSNARTDMRVARAIQKAERDASDSDCELREAEVTRPISEFVNIWKTAEEQYAACIDYETSGDRDLGCTYAPDRRLCAELVCRAKEFVDLIVGVIETVNLVTETVLVQPVFCGYAALEAAYRYGWTIAQDPSAVPGLEMAGTPVQQITTTHVEQARRFLQEAAAALAPFAACMLESRWTIEVAGAPIPMADGKLAIPYRVAVQPSAACAQGMGNPVGDAALAAAWTSGILLLAALNSVFAAALGIVVPPALTAAAATLSAGAAAAAGLMVAFILLMQVYQTMLAAQLAVAAQAGALADGFAIIEHKTLALASIVALARGVSAADLEPPLVLG